MPSSIYLATFCASLFPASAPLPLPFVCSDVGAIKSPVVWAEQRSSSRSHPAEIPARRSGVSRLGACLLLRDVDVGVTQAQFKSV